jgi:hypothetical protein
MKILLVLARDQYVRNLVSAGAFDALEGHDIRVVTSARHVRNLGPIVERWGAPEALPEPPRRHRHYAKLQLLLLAGYRDRSRTMAHKIELLPPLQRWRWKLASLPGLRALLRRLYVARAGRHRELDAVVARERPDLLIAPSGGIDGFVTDALRAARRHGVASLVIVHNWDNLSSKGAFGVRPDHVAVWGPQSVEQAQRIHGLPAEDVHVVGAPSLDHYFFHPPGSSRPRFPFRYALFAGCYSPFDELTPLRMLEEVIEREGLDLKVVYRPHPHRRARRIPDRFVEGEFRHVVLDPEVAGLYERSFDSFRGDPDGKPILPGLESYPSTFEHCEFVVCPLSTMIVEAAIFERRVIVVAYDDGIHPNSPAKVLHYDHFEGVEEVDGFAVCRTPAELPEHFARFARLPREPERSLRDQVGTWLYHETDSTYAERLASLVADIGA